VLGLVTSLTRTPADVPDELFAALRAVFSERELVEEFRYCMGELQSAFQPHICHRIRGILKGTILPAAGTMRSGTVPRSRYRAKFLFQWTFLNSSLGFTFNVRAMRGRAEG
jgi:hypothetical protein